MRFPSFRRWRERESFQLLITSRQRYRRCCLFRYVPIFASDIIITCDGRETKTFARTRTSLNGNDMDSCTFGFKPCTHQVPGASSIQPLPLFAFETRKTRGLMAPPTRSFPQTGADQPYVSATVRHVSWLDAGWVGRKG